MRLFRIIGLLTLVALLAACSTVKLAYNSLDNLAYWWLDGYLDFTDEQSPRVREEMRLLLRWHRSEELPRIASLLQRMEEIAPGPVSPVQACAFVAPLRDRLSTLTQQAEPSVVALALGLEPEQLAYLQRKYAKNDADFRKEWLLPATGEIREKRVKQLLERAEMIYGSLGEAQRQVVEDHVARSVSDPRRMLVERQRRQQDALQTLRRIGGQSMRAADARALLRGYLERAQLSPDPAYRALQEALIEETCRDFSALHTSTSAEQKDRAVRRLRGWQRDLRELSAQP